MARIRSINPCAPVDEDVATLSIHARYVWAYLPCHADREGRIKDSPFSLRLDILPLDQVDMNAILDELAKARHIIRYQGDDGRRYIQIRNFARHQRPHKNEPPSRYPSVPDANLSHTSAQNRDNSGQEQPLSGVAALGSGDLGSGIRKDFSLSRDPTTTVAPDARPPMRPYPVGAATAQFCAVYDAYPNGAGKAKAAGVWQAVAETFPGGEDALRDAVLASFKAGKLREDRYSGKTHAVPLLEKFLAEREWEDKVAKARGSPGNWSRSEPVYQKL